MKHSTQGTGTLRTAPTTGGRRAGAPLAILVGLIAGLLVGCAPRQAAPAPAAPGAAAGVAPAAAPAPPTPAPLKLRAGFTSISGTMAPLWAGYEAGYFAREGLDVEIFSFPSGNEGVQALMAGEVDFLQIAGATTVSAALGGGDTLVLATMVKTLVQSLIARPEIARPDDLRGKGVGISRLGTTIDTGARLALRHFGLEPDRDVAIVQAGAMSNILGSMEAGRVQAGILSYPSVSQARKLGFHELLDIGTLGFPYASTGVSARRSYVGQQPDVVRRFLRGQIAGIHRLVTDKPFALDLYKSYLKTDEMDVLEETYEVYALKYLQRVPYPDEQSIQGVLDELALEIPAPAKPAPATSSTTASSAS
ncbi:MAG TPA: ABC transporter substrate-binding protein [Chloroflexota bacterium]|nr:ABC transporter substrate-binding protein [Chloroflexota bacterium]